MFLHLSQHSFIIIMRITFCFSDLVRITVDCCIAHKNILPNVCNVENKWCNCTFFGGSLTLENVGSNKIDFRVETVFSDSSNSSPLSMHYWRGQSLKLHCGCGYLGLEETQQILRSLTPVLPSVNGHQTKLVLAHLCCLTDCKSLRRICSNYTRAMLSCVSSFCSALFFFFGIYSLAWPAMVTLYKRYRVVNTEYCKCYNYSCMNALPCVFVMPASIQNCTAAIFLLW